MSTIPRLSFDPSRLLTIYFRARRAGTRLLVFKNVDGTDYDLTGIDFEFFIKQSHQSVNKIMSLTIGDGLTLIDTNKIQIEFTEGNTNFREKEYFYELVNTTDGETWLNGAANAHDGKFDDKSSENNLTIALLGNEIVLTIQSGGNGSSGPVDWANITLDSVIANVNVGGITIGYDTLGKTLKQFITNLIRPYINPSFTSFSISGQSNTVEAGTTIGGDSKNVVWVINVGSGTVATIDIYDATAAATLLANTPNDGSQSVAFPEVFLENPGDTQSYRGILHDTGQTPNADFNSALFTITARLYRFYGYASSIPVDSTGVRALPQQAFQTSNAAVFNLNIETFDTTFIVAIPASASISSVIDLDALNVDITSEYILQAAVDVEDAAGTLRSYNVYAMTVAVPYSSNHRHQITTV